MAYRNRNISNWLLSVFFVFAASGNHAHKNVAAFDAYMPTSAVKLKLPINEQSESIFSKMPLARFQALTTANNSQATTYSYSLEENTLLYVNGTTGEIFMRTNYKPISEPTKYMLTAFAKGNLDTGHVLHLTLEITPQNYEAYCANLESVCFWTSARYAVAEHTASEHQAFTPIELGPLGTRAARYLCPIADVKYSMNTGGDYFELHGNRLFAKVPLDHEAHFGGADNNLKVQVTCNIWLSKQEQRTFSRTLNVTLLDRNDNGPELQDATEVYDFQLAQPYFKANETIGNKIIFVDKDAMATNAHLNYVIRNDVNNLIQPVCNAYETDHTGRPQTIISCQLIFARNGLLSQPRYCFQLEASDKTIDQPKVKKSSKAQICINTDVHKIHEADHPIALELRQQRKNPYVVYNVQSTLNAEGGGDTNSLLRDVNYEKDVFVYRTAHSYSRMTQPENFTDLLQKSPIKFAIVEDRSGAFAITSQAGILYVKDAVALEHAPETVYFVNVTWQDAAQQRAFVINVHLISGRPNNASCELKIKSRSQTCAQIKYQKQCLKFCGLATNGGSCAWRGSNAGFFGRNYASCVPEPKYCPDNVCDPLEELNTYACPQDCTPGNRIVGPHTTNDNKRGILSASGTCICEDNNKCSCAPLDDDEPKPKKKNKHKNEVLPENAAGNAVAALSVNADETMKPTLGPDQNLNVAGFVCGKSCMLIAITCPLIFIILLMCLVVSRRRLLRGALGKETTGTVKCGAPPDAECDVRNGDLPLMQLENCFKFDTTGDAKWEFEREKLQLDVVLGEGEFGKVVKGYANEIAGLRGVTTVAVKMLKKGANSVEYMALLSEFQLLQEVSHPNVIKLLGACTNDGESPLIIIEYARYGSLRGYLRLSRKIECAGVDYTDGVEPVTVKNILTFAWQICKGMAYLTEIKLVHRDLAARNVLLADGKICKISDFGLTRDVYEDDAYLKRSRDRVPVKWMAPESLADHVYTTKSDVWAFGVLCWELITLGASPYPGIPPQNLYHLLKTGYRMERPENCSEEVYAIVRNCWVDEPNARPSFKYLASQFEKLLGNNAKYIELESNAFSNPLYCSDEAALMSAETQLSTLPDDVDDPDCLEHLWSPPKIIYDTQECANSREQSVCTFGSEFQPPPGYDMPRPLIETNTTEQILRYENDLRFPLNIRKSIAGSMTPNYSNMNGGGICKDLPPHYSVPVKRGRSYMDMTNNTLIPDNLDNRDFEKHLSKTISFRFSSLLNLKEQDAEQGMV